MSDNNVFPIPATVNLTVSVHDARNEIEVPFDLVADTSDTSRLLGFLQESEVTVPGSPMLSKTERGYVLHETPEFG